MNVTFDEKADALYIQFQEGSVAKTRKIQDGVLIDIDEAGHLFGIEVQDVSERVPAESLRVIRADLPIRAIG